MRIIDDGALGRLEFDADGCAHTTVEFEGRPIAVDVNFRNNVDAAALAGPARLAADVAQLDGLARAALRADLASGDEDADVPMYRAHHIAELEAVVARRFFDLGATDPAADSLFLQALTLVRLGVYPESTDTAIVCDYTIDAEVTNYLLSVGFSPDGTVAGVSLES